MLSIDRLLAILALVCFLAATVGTPSRVNLVALGLALWILTLLV